MRHYEKVIIAQVHSIVPDETLQAYIVATFNRISLEQYIFCEHNLHLLISKRLSSCDKAPECDDFPWEFYKVFWDHI